tara:strand:+ start:385 stop:708 length:324 start_codon:yes stop_codon:yes gene_type:complete
MYSVYDRADKRCYFNLIYLFAILVANTSDLGDDVQTIAQMQFIPNILQSGKLRRKMPDWLKTSLLNVDFKNRRSVDLSQNLEIPARSSLTHGGGVMHQRNHWDDLYK